MSDEKSHEHHTSQPRAPIPLSHGPNHEQRELERPFSDDVKFIDRQFQMWAGSPAYSRDLRGKILAESSANPEERPGASPLAKKWESHLADIANSTEYDHVSLEGDPYERVFSAARDLAVNDSDKLAAILKIERLYKHREATMGTQQQYEVPLPDENNLLAILRMVLEQERHLPDT